MKMSTSITASISETQVNTYSTSAAPALQLSDGTTLDRVGNGTTDGSMNVVITLSDNAVAYLNALPSDVLNFLVNDWRSFDPDPSGTNTTGISTMGTVQTELAGLEQSWVNTINDPNATEAAKVNAYGTFEAVATLLDNVPSSIGGGVEDMNFLNETANSAFMQNVVDPVSRDYAEYGFNLVQSGQQFPNEDEFTAQGDALQGADQAVWFIVQDRVWGVVSPATTDTTQADRMAPAASSVPKSSILADSESSTETIDSAIAKMLAAGDSQTTGNRPATAPAKVDFTS